MNDEQKIEAAFEALRAEGFFAKARHEDSATSGWAEVPKGKDNVVFYHDGNPEAFDASGTLTQPLYLSHRGNSAKICVVLQAHGFVVEYDGNVQKKIKVVRPPRYDLTSSHEYLLRVLFDLGYDVVERDGIFVASAPCFAMKIVWALGPDMTIPFYRVNHTGLNEGGFIKESLSSALSSLFEYAGHESRPGALRLCLADINYLEGEERIAALMSFMSYRPPGAGPVMMPSARET